MKRPIRIAIASGKGGTGKTTVATNLAVVASSGGDRVAYVDCDVEEPNGHIFLEPEIRETREVTIPVPEIDESKCTFCGACSTACRYSAIVTLPQAILTFSKLCHGCGGCTLACPEDAITEVPRSIGVVESGISKKSDHVVFYGGRLDIGEAMAPPVIRAVLDFAREDDTLILDAPPGTSCPVIESVKDADVVLLVTEPTPFGLNDLKLAVEMVRELGLPLGVAVNRAGSGNDEVFDYCTQEEIPLLLELPQDRKIAEAYSRGELAIEAMPNVVKPLFEHLLWKLEQLASKTSVAPIERRSQHHRDLGFPSQTPSELTPSERLPAGAKPEVKELVVLSGKGGTGKTSIVASFAALADGAVVTDCDVDAADLHLVLDPTERARWPFSGGDFASIDEVRCTGCELCVDHCRFDAIEAHKSLSVTSYQVNPISCEGCGVCVDICPEGAVEMLPSASGKWFLSDARRGPLVHARLGIAQENSGKLVSLVRREGKAMAVTSERGLVISDGSPGIGCPVIASMAGATMVLVVIEPTLSGLHDLKRVLELTRQFNVKTGVCINKVDINPEVSAQIEEEAGKLGVPVLGYVHYDESVTRAQVEGKSVVELGEGLAAREIRALWDRVNEALDRRE